MDTTHAPAKDMTKPTAAPEAPKEVAAPPPKPFLASQQDLTRFAQLRERAEAAKDRADLLQTQAAAAVNAANMAQVELARFAVVFDAQYQLGPGDGFNVITGLIHRPPKGPPALEVAR